MTEVQDLLEEFHALETDPERINKEVVWQEINENIIPSLNSFTNDTPVKGQRRGENIYDGTPQAALQTYKSGLMGRLLSSYFNWFSIRTPDEDLMDVREVRMWLSKADQAIYGLIARSNFYPQIYEFFGLGGSIGHATLYRYWNPAKAQEVFFVQHPRSIYLAENEDGEIDTGRGIKGPISFTYSGDTSFWTFRSPTLRFAAMRPSVPPRRSRSAPRHRG